ncbi:hypothetical protein MTR_0090s0050 [Medicago truncatula]|uniref:Uncharacterized protein n=1 Tax=Medicago truncatula TaxID=3880 RepID=A0A072TIT0_MEDTR|nr:hypothetical protein MTR_0090s0050 [Medicago truncatula]
MIILPNSDITNPEVVENLLYVGTNPQVQDDGNDDGGDEEEVGAQHHKQKAGGNYNDERWAWMQNKVQRKYTEQQRQEMARRDDVALAAALQDVAQAVGQQPNANAGVNAETRMLETFLRNHPPTFKGRYDLDGA